MPRGPKVRESSEAAPPVSGGQRPFSLCSTLGDPMRSETCRGVLAHLRRRQGSYDYFTRIFLPGQ